MSRNRRRQRYSKTLRITALSTVYIDRFRILGKIEGLIVVFRKFPNHARRLTILVDLFMTVAIFIILSMEGSI
jgi:hypothetical protein